MADPRITASDCRDLCDEVDRVKALAGALWMAVHALGADERRPLAELSSVVEDRLKALSGRLRQAMNAAEAC